MKNSILILPIAIGITLVLIFFQVVLQVNPVSAQNPGSGTIRYVETNGSDSSNDCSDSSNPCKTIQHAIDAAGAGDEIRVAEGTYSEITTQPVPLRYQLSTTNTSIDQVVYISKTITLKGGFSAGDWTEYDPVNNPTIIDPQGSGRAIVAGEVITPVVGSFHPVVQGFHVTGGDAAGLEGGPANWDSGGGIYAGYFSESTILLEDMQVYSNTAEVGGGVHFDSVDSTVRNSGFRFNSASEMGGGLYIWGGTATSIEDSTIERNSSSGKGGGW